MNRRHGIIINGVCYYDRRFNRLSDRGTDIIMYQHHRYSYKCGLRVLTTIREKGLKVLFRLLIFTNRQHEEKNHKWLIKDYEENY